MALQGIRKPAELSYAGREIIIIASAYGTGQPLDSILELDPDTSQFTTMLMGGRSRGRKTYKLPVDPREYGLQVGSYVERGDGEMLAGRVVQITDNENRDDWFSVATEWYVTVERPWMQSDLATSLGQCKVEWMEDKLFPRVGQIISTPDDSYFRLGDLVRVS